MSKEKTSASASATAVPRQRLQAVIRRGKVNGVKTGCETEPETLESLGRTWDLLWAPAETTTMEKKYGMVPWAAEFWSAVTSCFFAAPVMIYFLFPMDGLPAITHVCIFCSILTAIMSTLYHTTLFKLFSSCDAAVATIMFWMNTVGLMTEVRGLGEHILWSSPTAWTFAIGSLSLFFALSWKETARPAMRIMGTILPIAVRGYLHLECYSGLALGFLGILFFVLDRKQICSTHALWHVFGGLCLLFTAFDVARSFRQRGFVVTA